MLEARLGQKDEPHVDGRCVRSGCVAGTSLPRRGRAVTCEFGLERIALCPSTCLFLHSFHSTASTLPLTLTLSPSACQPLGSLPLPFSPSSPSASLAIGPPVLPEHRQNGHHPILSTPHSNQQVAYPGLLRRPFSCRCPWLSSPEANQKVVRDLDQLPGPNSLQPPLQEPPCPWPPSPTGQEARKGGGKYLLMAP